MTPIWGMSQRLPRRVGTATAKRLMFTADIIDANEAVRIGLAEYNVPLEGFEQEIESLADRIVANSCFSHAENKRLLDASEGLTLAARSEEHTSELQSLMRISYDVFCLKKKTISKTTTTQHTTNNHK